MKTLALLTLLPLAVILVQLAFELKGMVGYSIYKLAFFIPPWMYLRAHRLSLNRDILKFGHWRRGLAASLGLGILAVLIFWGAYYALSDLLLDKAAIVAKINDQFSVNKRTVLLVAPFTILFNSLLEEFFYRGFAFGRLVRENRPIGYLLPAVAFTIQHLLFMYHWVTPLPFAIAVVGLFVFALVTELVYARTDTIVAPWLIHIFGDVAMMGIAVTMLFPEFF